MQVRPGTGGEEAALFALDLWVMYQKFAALRGWRFETMALTLTEGGGCKHGSAAISGQCGCSMLFCNAVPITVDPSSSKTLLLHWNFRILEARLQQCSMSVSSCLLQAATCMAP